MEISRIFRGNVLRYFYSSPNFLCFFYPRTNLHSDSFQKKAYFYGSSSRLSSICNLDCNQVQEKPSLNNSFFRLHSNCHFDSNSLQRKSTFSYSSPVVPSIFRLSNLSPLSLKTLALLEFNNIHNRSFYSPFGRQRLHNRRLFSVSSSDVSVHSEVGVVFDKVGWRSKGKRNRKNKGKNKSRRFNGTGMDLAPKEISNIIEIIKRDDDDMEVKLSLVAKVLSAESITEIFQVLNCQRTSGLRFFKWVRANNPRLYLSADFCSLVINNCGWLDDYDTMLSLLKEFKLETVCLHESAFWFLPVFRSSQSSLTNAVGRLIDLLNEVGGSCRSSGICALIEMFCNIDLFEMAKHVMEITQKKSHYNILVRRRCKKGHLVSDIIREMTEFGFQPTIETYNYLVGGLCKQDKMTEASSMLEIMQKEGVSPDASTFEIFVHKFCNCRKVDLAKEFLNKMVNMKLEPRLTTHTAIVKALFRSEQYTEAYNYVIDSSAMYGYATSKLYSLLANLHLSKGDLMSAQGIIVEMMDKGNKPDSEVYIATVKNLEKTGRDHSARDLRNMYSSFLEELNGITG